MDLKAWINAAHRDLLQSASADKASVDGRVSDTRKDLKGLQKYWKQVDTFLKSKFFTSDGASAPVGEIRSVLNRSHHQ